jgi:hypothetical protein
VSVNETLVEAKLSTFTLESTHFIFNKCPIYTHDGASAKFSTNSQETDYRVAWRAITTTILQLGWFIAPIDCLKIPAQSVERKDGPHLPPFPPNHTAYVTGGAKALICTPHINGLLNKLGPLSTSSSFFSRKGGEKML